MTKYERTSAEPGDDDGNKQEPRRRRWRTSGAEQGRARPRAAGSLRTGGPRGGSGARRARIAGPIAARCRSVGLQLSTWRATIELALRMGAVDRARRRARALRPTRHALPEETRARYAAQAVLRGRFVDHRRDIIDGDDDDDDDDVDSVDVVDSDDDNYEDRRTNGDRRHADGRENAAAGAPSTRDRRSYDAQSTPGRGH